MGTSLYRVLSIKHANIVSYPLSFFFNERAKQYNAFVIDFLEKRFSLLCCGSMKQVVLQYDVV